ncbi:hypothetical protein COV19_01230 [Candidatus Woesearchaeota archaeon CG10_big_fil_rev_8_21_14_0_10_44_13]|nr:MAG: hypothetical protein COV19_01230 [Candidatus Woesearchaeota archaeon CG10_big_fil_rev_8_21_14_0_10_44_13]
MEAYSRLIDLVGGFSPVHTVLARGADAELCYVHGKDTGNDPQYWLIEKKGKNITLTTLGLTGIVQSVSMIRGHKREHLLERKNGYGNFRSYTGQPVERLLAAAYDSISGFEFNDPRHKELFGWRADQIIARFGEMKQLYDEKDIVPEYNDTMVIAKISKSCPRACIYCPEPSAQGIQLYDMDTITHNMSMAKNLHEKYHGRFINEMNEGFLNTSSILWFHLAGRYLDDKAWREEIKEDNPCIENLLGRANLFGEKSTIRLKELVRRGAKGIIPDPKDIVGVFREHFPHLEKIYTFMGVPETNATSEGYLSELFNNAEGINRVLVGIESAHNPTSRFLGKKETAEDKTRAITMLQKAGFKVKVIVQVGAVGEGFYHGGRFVSGREGLEETAAWLKQTMGNSYNGKTGKILVSRYVPVEGTPLAEMHNHMRNIRPYGPKNSPEKEVRWFVRRLQKEGLDVVSIVDEDYEVAVQERRAIRTGAGRKETRSRNFQIPPSHFI